MHFLQELQATFGSHSTRIAVETPSARLTYGDLAARIESASAFLQARGMGQGDRVVLFTAERLNFLIAHFGVMLGGGVSLPLNPKFTREEMRHFLSDSQACIVVADTASLPMLEELRSNLPDLREIVAIGDIATAPRATPRQVERAAGDPCLMLYSSGTTGVPKGIVHTAANLASSLRALQKCWRVTPDDAVLHVLPIFHIHGLSFAAQMTLLVGGRLILEDGFQPQGFLDAATRSTIVMAVPTIYYRLLDHPGFRESAKLLQGVRLFTCGSAPIRPEVLPTLEEILGKPIINRYGMTESHVIASLPLHGPKPWGSVGLPLDGVELQVVKEDGNATAVGEVGSVRIRGANLFREYWRKPEATRKAFASGWFDTGDLGTLDTQGYLTLVGRSNDLIITNGYNVYPQVVERAINECPGVRESAVFGVADPLRGEQVATAIVRSEPTFNEDCLQRFLRERLVDYQRPRIVIFVDELPRNAMGKVPAAELRKLVS